MKTVKILIGRLPAGFDILLQLPPISEVNHPGDIIAKVCPLVDFLSNTASYGVVANDLVKYREEVERRLMPCNPPCLQSIVFP